MNFNYYSESTYNLSLGLFQDYKSNISSPPRLINCTEYILTYYSIHKKKYRDIIPKSNLINTIINIFEELYIKREGYADHILDVVRRKIPTCVEALQTRAELIDIRLELEEAKKRIQVVERKMEIIKPKNIYEDSQNVHTGSINTSVLEIAEKIITKYINLIDVGNSEKEKTEYRISTIFSISQFLGISLTYISECSAKFGKSKFSLGQLFLGIWFWICDHPNQQELKIRLKEELLDANKKCATGYLSRLVNVTQGFSEFQIKISEKERYVAIIKEYISVKLKDAPENVMDGIVSQSEEYKQFIRDIIGERYDEWIKDISRKEIMEIVKNFSGINFLE